MKWKSVKRTPRYVRLVCFVLHKKGILVLTWVFVIQTYYCNRLVVSEGKTSDHSLSHFLPSKFWKHLITSATILHRIFFVVHVAWKGPITAIQRYVIHPMKLLIVIMPLYSGTFMYLIFCYLCCLSYLLTMIRLWLSFFSISRTLKLSINGKRIQGASVKQISSHLLFYWLSYSC